jgi:rfaE bifunctional protein nucleotidyltransferase chain/domain
MRAATKLRAEEARMVERKIMSPEAISAELSALRRDGRKVVHCHGCFDLLHIGHIKHLQAARRMGDALVVTLTPDRYVDKGPGRPAFPEQLRAEAVAALDCVDFVAICREPTAAEAIRLFRPHYYVKGQEFESLARPPVRLAAELAALQEIGGQMCFTHEEVFSSTALLSTYVPDAGPTQQRAEAERGLTVTEGQGPVPRVRPAAGAAPSDVSDEAQRFLDGFRARHRVDDVLAGLATLRDLRVLILGEAIVDEYRYCVPLGKSPKEAIVTVKQVREERHAGGVLACANHVAGFCDTVDLVASLGGEAAEEQFVRASLRANVAPRFVVRPHAPTITKRRYMWEPFLVKMFEVVLLDDTPLPESLEGELLEYLAGTLPRYDLVIVADYGHGFLGQRAATALAEGARFLAVTTQANAANLGFHLVTKYPRVDYACIDEPEMRLATGERWRSVGDLADGLRVQLGAAAVSVTRGRDGALTCGPDGARWEVPPLSRDVVDRMGAGDAYLSVTAPCVAAGLPLDMVALLGGIAGALAVQVVGNRSAIDPAAVRRLVTALLR